MESNKYCIINAALGGWYPHGQQRLIHSLIYHGYPYDVLTFKSWPEGFANYSMSCPYNVKAACFEYALSKGYTHITWMDCSVWAIKDITPIHNHINELGYYILSSGYNAAQTCSDKCLYYFNLNRDQAELIPDSSSAVFGVNINNETGKEFIHRFIKAAKDGVFNGSREHDNQSQDPRFLFHRQDQSAVTCIAGLMKLKLEPLGEHVRYYESKMPEQTILTLRGL